MTKVIPFVLLLLTIALQSLGWGQTGHRVTGWIADQYLNKRTWAAIERILGGESLATASTWMDEIRSDPSYDHMADWHWVTIPEGKSYEKTRKNPNGDIIQTLERITRELKNKKLTPRQQIERLRILIHLTGDIHQPLHVSAIDDRGGNDVKITWFGTTSNLHRVWDSSIIDDTGLSYPELAQSLERPGAREVSAWQASSFREWAKESQEYHQQLYDYGDGRLGYPYAYASLPVVRHRLLQAGIRLAGILNAIYG